MFKRDTATAALAVGIFLGGLLAIGDAEAAELRAGEIKEFHGVDEIVEECTTTKNFKDIPQMHRKFRISGSASPAVVTFSGAVSLSGSEDFDTGFVRLLIDGDEQSPGTVPFVSAGSLSQGHAFTWQTRSLSVGEHTARVQWRTDLKSSFCVDARSLIVLHR